MDALIELGTSHLSALLHPLTPLHVVLFLVASVFAFYILETVLHIKWFRRLYAAFLILTIASLLQHGNSKEANKDAKKEVAKDIFKLALL
jgi:hypothetical protein